MAAIADLAGRRFGRLVVLSYSRSGPAGAYWLCQCDCGQTTVTAAIKLKQQRTKSCGCYRVERGHLQNRIHGECGSAEHKTLLRMIRRCTDAGDISYVDYGAKGVIVCSRWKNGEAGKSGVQCFIEDVGRKPSPRHTIDRFPISNGNYEPGNCRWATRDEQARNRISLRLVMLDGRSVCLAEVCQTLKIKYGTTWGRLNRGIPWEDLVLRARAA